MDATLQRKGELLVLNRDAVKKASKLEWSQMRVLGGMLFMSADMEANPEMVKDCRRLLHQKAGIFSNIRGIVQLTVVCKMCTQPDPEAYIDRVLEAYEALTVGRIFRSEYLVLTAMAMADYVEPAEFSRVAKDTWALLGQMRAEHPLLTSQADTTFAALMVISGTDTLAMADEMERCYAQLSSKGFLFQKDTAQAAAQVLSLSPKPTDEKVARFRHLRDLLKMQKSRLHNGPEQAILAAFADMDLPDEQIAAEISEMDNWLKKQRGFGALGIGSQLRRVMACVAVLEAHKEEIGRGSATAMTSALASSITQQIVMTIIMIIVIVSVNASIQASTSSK